MLYVCEDRPDKHHDYKTYREMNNHDCENADTVHMPMVVLHQLQINFLVVDCVHQEYDENQESRNDLEDLVSYFVLRFWVQSAEVAFL